ncbi:MAG: hypothetical protein Aurels2KO_13990 [Aureliella sp.]
MGVQDRVISGVTFTQAAIVLLKGAALVDLQRDNTRRGGKVVIDFPQFEGPNDEKIGRLHDAQNRRPGVELAREHENCSRP